DPVQVFKTWLSRLTILSPIPDFIHGHSNGETLHLKKDGSNFAEWLEGLLGIYPAAYTSLDKTLKQVLPDFVDFQGVPTGGNSKKLVVQFARNTQSFRVDLEHLSSGEKCFFIWSAILAANAHMGGLFCFWDEVDNHLSLSEIGHFTVALRQSHQQQGQIILTTHSEAILRRFSHENTFYLARKSHLEPTIVRPLSEVYKGRNIVQDLILDDIEL
ncbi:MAG: AAA family ATPase, partial [Chloroherpetonaceae bacterium]